MRGLKAVTLADTTGYAAAGMELVRLARDGGVPVMWQPLARGPGLGMGYEVAASPPSGPADLRELAGEDVPYDTVLMATVPEYFEPLFEDGPRRWGATVWETDRLPAHWPALLARVDGLLVPTSWNRDVFRECGVSTPIAVVPHVSQFGGEPGNPDHLSRMRLRLGLQDDDGRVVFYSIGMWMPRKGLDLTVEAFCRAFSADDPVVLVVKTTEHDGGGGSRFRRFLPRRGPVTTADAVAAIRARHSNPPPVLVISERLEVDDIRALHAVGNCYMSLSRAEGWGLGAYEAAFFGHPVVATGHEGHRAFLTDELAWLVASSLEPVRAGRSWSSSYSSDQHWHRPDLDHAVMCLRAVLDDIEAARSRGRALSAQVSRRFDRAEIANRLVRALSGDTV